jgi:small subunit ribosomal protein S20
MPHRHAATKSLRKDRRRTLRNKMVKSRLHTEQVKFDHMLERGDIVRAEAQLALLTKLYQQAADRKVVHGNRAARKQSRLAIHLNQARAKTQAAQ